MTNHKNIEEIIESYNTQIQNVIRKFNKSESDVEDIKQEVYIKTWKNMAKFATQTNPWSFINKITVNTCIDHFRANKKRLSQTCNENERLENIPSNVIGLDKKIIMSERQKLILDSINKLTPKFREVIILYDIEELTYEEISKKLNCPIGTIKSRLFNARKILRQKLSVLLTEK